LRGTGAARTWTGRVAFGSRLGGAAGEGGAWRISSGRAGGLCDSNRLQPLHQMAIMLSVSAQRVARLVTRLCDFTAGGRGVVGGDRQTDLDGGACPWLRVDLDGAMVKIDSAQGQWQA
jgi:hypothetical protein